LIAKYKQQEADAAKELKRVRKNLARDIDSLQTTLKVVNIAGMPAIVALTGICLAIVRRQRTKAK
jgi:NaMN:DMB phosphoribosyltransferase